MKILQIAPMYLPLRPDLKYGGTERVVLALDKVFTQKGHEVVTAAPRDAEPYGELLPTLDQSEWTKPRIEENPDAYEEHVGKIMDHLKNKKPDIIHDHTGNFVLSETFSKRRLKIPQLQKIPIIVTPHHLRRFKKSPVPEQDNIFFTALSIYQEKIFSEFVKVSKVIYNGVFVYEYPFSPKKQKFLFSLGSIDEYRGQDLAMRVALETHLPLKIGGRITDRSFYESEIRPFLGNKIEYVGELNDKEKKVFFKDAMAFLAPIKIGDCFSLTRIEALACGTPVITLDTGSAREAITHGETGYIAEYFSEDVEKSVDEIVNYVNSIGDINPLRCRQEAESRFDWRNIGNEYLNLYNNVISGKPVKLIQRLR
jgi:glycosyltransferase involved in cell wall biosynthesis